MYDPNSKCIRMEEETNSTVGIATSERVVPSGMEAADGAGPAGSPGLNPCSAATLTSYIIFLSLNFHICKMG